MGSEMKHLREFGKFRLDAEKKLLWHDGKVITLPLKEVELLCVLTETGGEVVTKDELLEKVWADAFVEESNLTRHIYLLRQAFKGLGEAEEMIQTVPRRGYRFAGEVRALTGGELIIEKHSTTQTVIEELPAGEPMLNGRAAGETLQVIRSAAVSRLRQSALRHRRWMILAAIVVAVSSVAAWRYARTPAGGVTAIKSLAVLPFKTIGGDGEGLHQGLGLADILITRLSNIKEIRVRPTSAVMAFADTRQDSVGLGQYLQVDAVLEGTIYRAGGDIRVTARLIDVRDQSSIWAGQFEKPARGELRLQNEIALQVAEALALNLSGSEKDTLTKRYTESADAYRDYARGRYEWNKRNQEGMRAAERLFGNAIEKDPNFALAYVGVADVIIMGRDPSAANVAISRALEIDPNLAEAYASLGFINTFHTWQWQNAEDCYKKSIELNPGYATAHHWYATLLAIQGRTDEAEAEMRRALEINPLSHNFLTDIGEIHYFARQYDLAEEYCRKALELYPDFIHAHNRLYNIFLRKGEYDKAVDEYLEFSKTYQAYSHQSKENMRALSELVDSWKRVYQQGGIGKFIKLLMTLDEAEGLVEKNPNIPYIQAQWHSLLGNKEKALDNLEIAYARRAFHLPFVKAEPAFDPLRAEPRYREILRKMNLE